MKNNHERMEDFFKDVDQVEVGGEGFLRNKTFQKIAAAAVLGAGIFATTSIIGKGVNAADSVQNSTSEYSAVIENSESSMDSLNEWAASKGLEVKYTESEAKVSNGLHPMLSELSPEEASNRFIVGDYMAKHNLVNVNYNETLAKRRIEMNLDTLVSAYQKSGMEGVMEEVEFIKMDSEGMPQTQMVEGGNAKLIQDMFNNPDKIVEIYNNQDAKNDYVASLNDYGKQEFLQKYGPMEDGFDYTIMKESEFNKLYNGGSYKFDLHQDANKYESVQTDYANLTSIIAQNNGPKQSVDIDYEIAGINR